MSLNIGELEGFTRDWGPSMVSDTYFNQHVLLKSMETTRETYPGGDYIRIPLNVRGDRQDKTGRALGYTEAFDFPKLEVGTWRGLSRRWKSKLSSFGTTR